MEGIIYKYTSPADKIYIGQTTDERRRRKTFFNLNKSYGGAKIDRARLKYGPESFKYEVLFKAEFETAHDAQFKLDELERIYIKEYDTYKNGYNMTFGGYTTTGLKLSEEQKKRMSESRKGKKHRPRTEEERQFQSRMMKEKWASEGYRKLRERISQSEEHKRKKSESVRGSKNGMYGKKHSESSRKKMSVSRFGEKNYWYGKTKDPEYRNKISHSKAEYYRTHSISVETKEKISSRISTPVRQISKEGNIIATFDSTTIAGMIVGIDASCIVKVCKGKRQLAGGYKWEYVNKLNGGPVTWDYALLSDEWLDIAEIVRRTGRNRNVIYYHIKKHNVPIVLNGRRRLIDYPALVAIFSASDS